MLVYYGGEDTVTKLIAKRMIRHVAPSDHELILEDANPRDYGTRALEKMDLICRLSNNAPVVCVFDSDGDCVVELLKRYAPNGWKKDRLAINVAIDEGESWLMADRAGFSKYISRKSKVRDIFKCEQPCKKPPTYNNLWPDYIENYWNIEEAAENSRSLSRTIDRVRIALLA